MKWLSSTSVLVVSSVLALSSMTSCKKENSEAKGILLPTIGITAKNTYAFHYHRVGPDGSLKDVESEVRGSLAWASKWTTSPFKNLRQNFGPGLYAGLDITPQEVSSGDVLVVIPVKSGRPMVSDPPFAGWNATGSYLSVFTKQLIGTYVTPTRWLLFRNAAPLDLDNMRIYDTLSRGKTFNPARIPFFAKPDGLLDALDLVYKSDSTALRFMINQRYGRFIDFPVNNLWQLPANSRDAAILYIGVAQYSKAITNALNPTGDEDLVYRLRDLLLDIRRNPETSIGPQTMAKYKEAKLLAADANPTTGIECVQMMIKTMDTVDPTLMINLRSHFDVYDTIGLAVDKNYKAVYGVWESLINVRGGGGVEPPKVGDDRSGADGRDGADTESNKQQGPSPTTDARPVERGR